MKLSRRDMLKGVGGALLGTALGAGSVLVARDRLDAAAGPSVAELPWSYKTLDLDSAAENAYDGYYAGACCYGAFHSIITELAKTVGAPFNTIPTAMMIYGEGGIAGVGSVCGALNGAAAAIFLVAGGMDKKKREPAFELIRDLYTWYEQNPLPDYKPRKPKYEIIKSVSRSNLCHASVSTGCKAAKVKSFSKERSERCAWLTASVARHTVDQLNKYAAGNLKMMSLSSEVKTCRSCHDQGGAIENTRGMMDCGGCHFKGPSKHVKI
jgi:hypothetical protein